MKEFEGNQKLRMPGIHTEKKTIVNMYSFVVQFSLTLDELICTYQGAVELGWVWPCEGFAVAELVESGTYLAVGQRGVKMMAELRIALLELEH